MLHALSALPSVDAAQLGRALLDSHLLDLFAEGLKFGLLGGFAGLVLAFVAFFGLRKWGGYHFEWRHAKWLRGLTFVMLLFLCPFCLGAYGLVHGGIKGAAIVLEKSQLGTQVLPEVGNAGADVVAWIYVEAGKASGAGSPGDVAAFREGKWSVDVAELSVRFGQISADVARKAVDSVRAELYAKFPSWKDGGESAAVSAALVEVESGLQDSSARERLLKALLAAAKARGVTTLTRAEISELLVKEALVPGLIAPLKSVAKSQQQSFLIFLALGLLIPVIGFRSAEAIRASRAKKAAASPAM